MVNPDTAAHLPFWQGLAPTFWHQLTRLGEAQLLLPALLLASVWLARSPGGARSLSGLGRRKREAAPARTVFAGFAGP